MRDPKKEHLLNELGFAWEFVQDYDISKIDWQEADANHARLGTKLDLDVVCTYGEAMDQGADWTAITVRDALDSIRGDQLIDGRHTGAAMKVSKPERHTVDAYVVRDPDPYRIDMLIRICNINNGRSSPLSERLLHIADMRQLWPHATAKELAARFKVKLKTVQDYLKVLDAEKRATDLGVLHIMRSARGQFTMELKRALNTLPGHTVFQRAVQLIAKHPLHLRGSAAIEFVQAVKDASGSERRALKLIDDRAHELSKLEAEQRDKKSRSPSTRMTIFMGGIRRTERQYPGTVDKLYMEGLTCVQLRRERRVITSLMDILIDVGTRMDTLIEEQEAIEQWTQRNKRPGSEASDPISPQP